MYSRNSIATVEITVHLPLVRWTKIASFAIFVLKFQSHLKKENNTLSQALTSFVYSSCESLVCFFTTYLNCIRANPITATTHPSTNKNLTKASFTEFPLSLINRRASNLYLLHKEEIKNETSLSKEKIFLMECHKISMKLYPFRDWSCAWIFFHTNYLLWTTTFHGDVLISYPLDLIKSRLAYRLCF